MDLPITLIERPENYNSFIGILLFFAFFIISLARLSKPMLFRKLFVSWTKVQGLRSYLRESFPLNKRSSFLLIVNYFIAGSVLLFLKLDEYNLGLIQQIVLSAAIPIVVFVFGLLGLTLTGWITGESKITQTPLYMRVVGVEVSGILFLIAAMVWMLNVNLVPFVWFSVVLIFIAESISRLVKSIIVVSSNGVSWFYIILYLCTLEILPLFIAYYLVVKNFGIY